MSTFDRLATRNAAVCFPPVLLFAHSNTATKDWVVVKRRKKSKGWHPEEKTQERRPEDGQAAKTGAARASSTDAAFEGWLRQKLAILYGPVADEPIPEELLNLIAGLKQEKKD